MLFPKESVEVFCNSKPVKIDCISTGAVSVKTKFREAKHKGSRAFIDLIVDKQFTEWLPVWVWLIEHPEGNFLVDTGSSININSPDYFKSSGIISNWINRKWFKFLIKKENDIENQLISTGINPKEIGTVVLTHLHLDHTDGLTFFENSNILVNETEWQNPYGHLPKLFPKWLNPNTIKLAQDISGFNGAYLTTSKNLIAIHTPGHTFGHTSILLKTDSHWVLFAGDVCFYEKQLIENKFSGGNVNQQQASETYERIKQFCTKNNVIVLPSHDKDAVNRLKNKIYLKIKK